jgi:hypothetical protein
MPAPIELFNEGNEKSLPVERDYFINDGTLSKASQAG